MLLMSPSTRRQLPAVIDPLRRVPIPRDVDPPVSRGPEVDPESVGMTRQGVEDIWQHAMRLYRLRLHPALSLCVRREGHVVLNRTVGWSRGISPRHPFGMAPDGPPVEASVDTPFCVFSSSKAITATVIHLLDERGIIRTTDRVAEYVPSFRVPGKQDVTIEHVLSHRSGLPFLPRGAVDIDKIDDRDHMIASMAAATMMHRAGAKLAYHAVSGGFVLGEVVLQATGKDIRTVLAEEILTPLGFRWTNYGVSVGDLPAVGMAYPTGPMLLPPASLLIERALGLPGDQVTAMSNDPRFLTGIVPAANVVTTANELSRFMDLLRGGGTLDGVTVLNPRTIRSAVVERTYHQLDRTLGLPIRHGNGFMLGARTLSLYGPDTEEAFGHLGFTNVMAWADPRRELAVGLITSGKPFVTPHVAALWDVTRQIGLAAPKVADPVLFRP